MKPIRQKTNAMKANEYQSSTIKNGLIKVQIANVNKLATNPKNRGLKKKESLIFKSLDTYKGTKATQKRVFIKDEIRGIIIAEL